MSLALTVQSVNHELRRKKLYLIATASGNYVTGGDTVNLQAITPALGQAADATVGYPGTIKHSEVCNNPDGYTSNLIPGATLATWKLQVFASDGTELAAGAYPAGVIATPFVFSIEGPKGQL